MSRAKSRSTPSDPVTVIAIQPGYDSTNQQRRIGDRFTVSRALYDAAHAGDRQSWYTEYAADETEWYTGQAADETVDFGEGEE